MAEKLCTARNVLAKPLAFDSNVEDFAIGYFFAIWGFFDFEQIHHVQVVFFSLWLQDGNFTDFVAILKIITNG